MASHACTGGLAAKLDRVDGAYGEGGESLAAENGNGDSVLATAGSLAVLSLTTTANSKQTK